MIFIETPLPTPPADFDLNLVTPTWVGFTVTALVVIATILLILDMVRRIRRLRYRAEIGEILAEEIAAAKAGMGNGSASNASTDTDSTDNDSSGVSSADDQDSSKPNS